MEKSDFKKILKPLYQPSRKEFSIVTVPEMTFLKVNGSGPPGNNAYVNACQWLYGISYGLKFNSKKELDKDYVVPPLEGLWWADDLSAYVDNRRDEWQWTLMIMQPAWITKPIYLDCLETKRITQGEPPASLRFESFDEGLSAQIMHIGPYSDEAPTIKFLHEQYLPEHGYIENGDHHEIYISDPRRCAPEKLKTVLRQPIRSIE